MDTIQIMLPLNSNPAFTVSSCRLFLVLHVEHNLEIQKVKPAERNTRKSSSVWDEAVSVEGNR